MHLTLSKPLPAAIKDYSITFLHFAGFSHASTLSANQEFSFDHDLATQSDAMTLQQHLTLGLFILYLLEDGIGVEIMASANEKFHIGRVLESHGIDHCLLSANPAQSALLMLA